MRNPLEPSCRVSLASAFAIAIALSPSFIAAPAGREAASQAAATIDKSIGAEALMATVKFLASPELEGRRAGSPGGLKAREWLADRFRAIGLEPLGSQYVQPFTPGGKSAGLNVANVTGRCRAQRGPKQTIVISAHYDHLGVRDGTVYPGADDNASGVAVLLGMAERCRRQPFTHDAIFVAFDAEEIGLQGARAFVAKPPIPKEEIALNINLDMVSRSDRRELFAAGTYHWPLTRAPLEQVAAGAPVKLRFGHDKPKSAGEGDDWTMQSDHGVFHQAGIPFIYFGVEDHPDYHQPSDTADRIKPEFLQAVAATILDAVERLDAALPLRR